MASGSERAISPLVEEVIEQRTHKIGLKGIFRHAQSRLLNTERAKLGPGKAASRTLDNEPGHHPHTDSEEAGPGPSPWPDLQLYKHTYACAHTHRHRYSGGHSCTHTPLHSRPCTHTPYTHAHAHTRLHRHTHTCVPHLAHTRVLIRAFGDSTSQKGFLTPLSHTLV